MKNITLERFKLIGLKLEHKTTNENGQSNVDCGNLWQKFESEKIFEQIPNKKNNSVYAVYFDYDEDETKPFSYFIGCQVDENMNTPEGLSEIIIPSQSYQKVIAKGEVPYCISNAWSEIWSSEMNRIFGYDFEIYDERSHDWKNAEVDLFISIDPSE